MTALGRWERPALVEGAAGNLALATNVYCEVRTEVEGNALAALFEDRAGATPLANPFLASSGVPAFHVAGGSYQVRFYKAGYDETFRYQAIGTAQEVDTEALTLAGELALLTAEVAALADDLEALADDLDAMDFRERLTANRTYYVRSDGSNGNDGLADTAGGAFLTIQKAMDVLATIDFNGFTVTVQVRDGTYAGFTVPVTVGQATVAKLVIQGNSSTPANVAITSAMSLGPGARATIKDMAVTSAGHGLVADGAGAACAFANIAFGACTSAQIYVASGATMTMTGNCSFTGSSQVRVWARWNAVYVEEFRTCTYTSTPAYSVANMYVLSGATASSAVSTQTGSATGVRYNVQGGALVETGGGGVNFYPGNSAGSTSNGGLYT